jgi:SAM-dependent methyltransferase
MTEQRYVIDDSVQRDYVAARDVRTFLPFLVTYLQPGLDVLDAGCGVGSIALDVAPMVAPGRVSGIDVDGGQIEAAQRSARERGIDNAEFQVGSVLELPFEDASFDVVYANAVLFYLRDQVEALAEMRRVLRPDGLAAVSDDDLGTIVMTPETPDLRRGPELFERAVAHEGGNTRYSRNLRTLMTEAGFARTQGFATAPETYGDLERTQWFAEVAIGVLGAPAMAEVIVEEGWASREELDRVLAALREWGGRPDAFGSWLYCGAIGWVS